MDASTIVTNLNLPLPTPLQESNVVQFRIGPRWTETGPQLASYLVYQGGYGFWHFDGCICGFYTPRSVTRLDDPDGLPGLYGEVRYSEEECLAKAREAIRAFGFTNATALRLEPTEVRPPTKLSDGVLPRFMFTWETTTSQATRSGEVTHARPIAPGESIDGVMSARCEVNATTLSVEHLTLLSSEYRRTPWPMNFGQTNVVMDFEPKRPVRTEMLLEGVSREFAMAFIRAVLPECSRVCAGLDVPIPNPITEGDIDYPQSKVGVIEGRVSATVRLKCGYLVVFYAGHVWAVHAEDALVNSPAMMKKVRASEEYRSPVRFSNKDVVEKLLHILVDRLRLPAHELFLDTAPVFVRATDPEAPEGVRRYVLQWQRPETESERAGREANRIIPEVSVAVEIDAVSGVIKAINFLHESFERPDPKVDVPMNERSNPE